MAPNSDFKIRLKSATIRLAHGPERNRRAQYQPLPTGRKAEHTPGACPVIN
jgi:hypothetical protein